jgi:hypothetical protein
MIRKLFEIPAEPERKAHVERVAKAQRCVPGVAEAAQKVANEIVQNWCIACGTGCRLASPKTAEVKRNQDR